MKNRAILPLFLGLALFAVFLLAAFAPEVFTAYDAKGLLSKWLPISREHPLSINAMGSRIGMAHYMMRNNEKSPHFPVRLPLCRRTMICISRMSTGR